MSFQNGRQVCHYFIWKVTSRSTLIMSQKAKSRQTPRASSSSSARARRWTWTLNNPTTKEMISLSKLSKQDGVDFLIFGAEKGSQGTFHFQGYCEFSNPMRLGGVKALLGSRLHLEPSQGTSEQNIKYCCKEHQVVVIYGVSKGSNGDQKARRSRERCSFEEKALVIKDLIDSGLNEQELWDQEFAFMLKNHRAISSYLRLHRPERPIPPKVELLIGKPGTGKTRFVHDFARIFYDNDLWTWAGDRWFDGFAGQRVALFDDFRGEIPLSSFLKCLDRYNNQQPVKGGFVWFNPERIFITSNEAIHHWYPDAGHDSIQALRRRVREFIVMDNIY